MVHPINTRAERITGGPYSACNKCVREDCEEPVYRVSVKTGDELTIERLWTVSRDVKDGNVIPLLDTRGLFIVTACAGYVSMHPDPFDKS